MSYLRPRLAYILVLRACAEPRRSQPAAVDPPLYAYTFTCFPSILSFVLAQEFCIISFGYRRVRCRAKTCECRGTPSNVLKINPVRRKRTSYPDTSYPHTNPPPLTETSCRGIRLTRKNLCPALPPAGQCNSHSQQSNRLVAT